MAGMIDPSTCSHPTSARQKGANQYARWENCTKCQRRLPTEKRDYWKEAKILREKALEKEEMARRMEEQKNRAFSICPKTASATSPGSHTRTDERSVEKRSTEQARVPATHVGAAITDAAGSSATGVCSDVSHSTGRGNTTSSDGMDIRGDAAKDLARVARDGSTSEGQRLREQLWVWLHLQDEEATEPEPKQVQSWLTGQKTEQGKEFKRNRRHHSSQVDSMDLLSTTHHSPRCQTRTSHATPTNRLDGGLGRDHGDRTRQVEGHLKATKTLDDNPQTLRAFLECVSAQ